MGPYYTRMVEEVHEALGNLQKYFPSYDGGGYELAGLVWYHGWNDGCDPKNAVPEYEQNLVSLIKDLRRDLKAPRLPVVIGELTGPWGKAEGPWAAIRKAQADAAARPEFKGTVLFVETHDFVRPPEESPCPTHGHHEFANAETYFLVGNALGQGMKSLLAAASADGKPDPPKPTSRTVRDIEGWTVRIDDQALGFDNSSIVAAYERFKQSGHGDSVLLVTGKHARHYALTDPKEFFAEMSEAYFGMNDFFPFNRAELMTAEPEIFELLQTIWGQSEPSQR